MLPDGRAGADARGGGGGARHRRENCVVVRAQNPPGRPGGPRAGVHGRAARTKPQSRENEPMTEDELPQGELDDAEAEAELSQIHPDELLITRYLINGLTPDERARFEARLEDDDDFYARAWPAIQVWRVASRLDVPMAELGDPHYAAGPMP